MQQRRTRMFICRPETIEIGGKTYRYRSQGEVRLARYLDLLKGAGVIKDWAYEQTTFVFPDDRYVIDFDVILPDGRLEYYEYKGMFDARSRRKLKLLLKYRPEVRLNLVFGQKSDARKVSKRLAAACNRLCVLGRNGLIDIGLDAAKWEAR